MAVRYRIDPGAGRFTVQGFATGVLSAFAHSPTFAVRDYRGEVRLVGGEIKGLELDLTVNLDSLDLEDRVRPADRSEIEGRMRREVLETAKYRDLTYRARHLADEVIGPGTYRLRLGGEVSLHGETRPLQVDLELLLFRDGLRLRGGCPLRLSDYGIRPVTALAGAIKLKDELRVSFDIGAVPEES